MAPSRRPARGSGNGRKPGKPAKRKVQSSAPSNGSSVRKSAHPEPIQTGETPVPYTDSPAITAIAVITNGRRWCGAKTRTEDGRYPDCHHPAGFRTDHPGEGRCYLHGGRSVMKHGRYSTVKRLELRRLIEEHANDDDPLDILPELAAARALFQDYIERYDEWREGLLAWHASFSDASKPHTILDIADATRILSEVTKIAARIENVRAQNAISRADFNRVLAEMWRVLEFTVRDPATVQEVRNGWLNIRL